MGDDVVNDDYEVGYCKPPKHSQWPKGVSGNPGGPKKGLRTLDEEVAAVFNERITVTQNGQRTTMTKLRATLTQVINKAAAGDPKATRLAMDLARQSDNAEAMQAVLEEAKAITSPVQIFQLPDNGR